MSWYLQSRRDRVRAGMSLLGNGIAGAAISPDGASDSPASLSNVAGAAVISPGRVRLPTRKSIDHGVDHGVANVKESKTNTDGGGGSSSLQASFIKPQPSSAMDRRQPLEDDSAQRDDPVMASSVSASPLALNTSVNVPSASSIVVAASHPRMEVLGREDCDPPDEDGVVATSSVRMSTVRERAAALMNRLRAADEMNPVDDRSHVTDGSKDTEVGSAAAGRTTSATLRRSTAKVAVSGAHAPLPSIPRSLMVRSSSSSVRQSSHPVPGLAAPVPNTSPSLLDRPTSSQVGTRAAAPAAGGPLAPIPEGTVKGFLPRPPATAAPTTTPSHPSYLAGSTFLRGSRIGSRLPRLPRPEVVAEEDDIRDDDNGDFDSVQYSGRGGGGPLDNGGSQRAADSGVETKVTGPKPLRPQSAVVFSAVGAAAHGVAQRSDSTTDVRSPNDASSPESGAGSSSNGLTISQVASTTNTTPVVEADTALLAKRSALRAQRPTSSPARVKAIAGGYLRERFSDHVQLSSTILGSGSFGAVYQALDEKSGRMIAVKRLRIPPVVPSGRSAAAAAGGGGGSNDASHKPSSAAVAGASSSGRTNDPHKALLVSTVDECMRDVVDEIRLMRSLRHPNIVSYYYAEVVGSHWEEQHQARRSYLREQRRRLDAHLYTQQASKLPPHPLSDDTADGAVTTTSGSAKSESASGGGSRGTFSAQGSQSHSSVLSPLSPLPPLKPPGPELTAVPKPSDRRELLIFMEYMSGGSLGHLLKVLVEQRKRTGEVIPEPNPLTINSQEASLNPEQSEAAAAMAAAESAMSSPRTIVSEHGAGAGFTEDMIRAYFTQVLDGLAYLHDNNIVHRDIKADNLLLSANGTVCISDFGTSRRFADVSSLGSRDAADCGELDLGRNRAMMTVAGTPWFMAPEVIMGTGHGFPADIWSIGSTVIHLLTGRVPFSEFKNPITAMFQVASNPLRMLDEVPSDASPLLQDFIRRCVAAEPAERWTARQLRQHPFLVAVTHIDDSLSSSGALDTESDPDM